jgi:hypothetical protein
MAAVDRRDLVLGLDGPDAEALVHRQLFETLEAGVIG